MEKVIVSRQWANPEITIEMSTDGISIKMDMDEYLESLVSQVTNLSITFTKATLLAKLKEGHSNIVKEMKKSTTYAV